jgi:hypothetical protein
MKIGKEKGKRKKGKEFLVSWARGDFRPCRARSRMRPRRQPAQLGLPAGATRGRRCGHGPMCQRGGGGNGVRGDGGPPGRENQSLELDDSPPPVIRFRVVGEVA